MTDVSIWAYPWDIHDLTPATACDRIKAAGANMISLATSYHAGRFVQPGNPKRRVYFPQDGTVYYRPDPSRWQGHEIQPLQADIVATEGDMLADLIRRRDNGGVGVSAWTVCLHNTRLGMLHPNHSLRTAYSDPSFYGLCPSSPAAHAYVVTMVNEIAETYAPDRIEIESPDFMAFSHGYHHEKDGLPLMPQQDFLLGICFCNHCQQAADAAGVPAEAARKTVTNLLDIAFARELPDPQSVPIPPELQAYLDWRSTPVTALIAEIRQAVPKSTQLLLIDDEGTEATGINLPALIPHVDGILHCAYRTSADKIAPLMAATKALLGPSKSLIAGFQLFHPNVANRADLENRVAQTRPHADGLNFYCLGLVPPARLDWIRTALG
ncbi:MAG: hypothetical protein ABIV25_01305 [Paracoccaceae bacterium]